MYLIYYVLPVLSMPKCIFVHKKSPLLVLGALGKTFKVQFTIAQHDHQDFVLMYLTILLRLRVSLNCSFLFYYHLFIILKNYCALIDTLTGILSPTL